MIDSVRIGTQMMKMMQLGAESAVTAGLDLLENGEINYRNLITKRGMHSFAFADKKTLDDFSEEMKKRG